MHPRAEIIFRSNHIINHRGFYGMFEFRDEGKYLYAIEKSLNENVINSFYN